MLDTSGSNLTYKPGLYEQYVTPEKYCCAQAFCKNGNSNVSGMNR